MSEKRRDNKGRILRTGESQRKDLLYQYRYTDRSGKRITVYAPSLNELRKKEEDISNAIKKGLDYSKGEVTANELIQQYLAMKQNVRPQTMQTYQYVANTISKYAISYQKINTIKISQAKLWVLELSKDGYSCAMVNQLRNLIKASFQMACDEDILSKNPFDFQLSMVKNNSTKREALSDEDQIKVANFFRTQSAHPYLYDIFIILLGTGLRVSELCGLTINDLDFLNKKIHVNKQIVQGKHGQSFISNPKTKSGIRDIPMSLDVEKSFQSILNQRKVIKQEPVIDGVSGFILLNRRGNVMPKKDVEKYFHRTMEKFNATNNSEHPVCLTPHVLRHTFCTNLIQKNINIKSLQYLMGHANVNMTLDIYSHIDYTQAEQSFRNLL